MKFARIPLTSVILIVLPAAPARGNDTTRQFPAFNCRYTIQSDDWDWVGEQKGGSLCTLAHDRGWGFSIAVEFVDATHITPMMVRSYDENLWRLGVRKRGGRQIAYLGLPCYQFEGTLPDGRSTAIRLLVVNGLMYHLTVVGDKKPVEEYPEFERCLGGFSFIAEPAPPKPTDPAAGYACLGVIVGGACLFVFLIARANRKPKRRPPPDSWLTLGDDFLRERPIGDPHLPTVRVPGGSAAPTMATLAPPVEVIRDKTKSGLCRGCGRRVQVDARLCPFCGKPSPNPSEESRWAGRGLIAGGAVVGLGAALYCFFKFGGDGASVFAGVLFGGFGGAIAGLLGGVIVGWVQARRKKD